VFTVPTEQPESDGTLVWHETTVEVLEVNDVGHGAGRVGVQRWSAVGGHGEVVGDPSEGMLTPDLTRAGMGLEPKRADAERYRRAA
jgi:ubiquinone/menaquinone biosynthesis C-methylase UbiE